MKDVQVAIAGNSTTTPIPLDYLISPFQVSVSIGNVSGTISVTCQYTYDSVFGSTYDPSTGNWYNLPLMTLVAAQADAVINAAPVRAVRFVNAAAGTCTGRVIQAGTGQ